jgi:hypothetical protein
MTVTLPSPTASAATEGLPLRAATTVQATYRLQCGAAITAQDFVRCAPQPHSVRPRESAMTDFAASSAVPVGAECGVDDALD